MYGNDREGREKEKQSCLIFSSNEEKMENRGDDTRRDSELMMSFAIKEAIRNTSPCPSDSDRPYRWMDENWKEGLVNIATFVFGFCWVKK